MSSRGFFFKGLLSLSECAALSLIQFGNLSVYDVRSNWKDSWACHVLGGCFCSLLKSLKMGLISQIFR